MKSISEQLDEDVKNLNKILSFYDLGYFHGIEGKPRMWHSGIYAEGYSDGLRYRQRWIRTN